MKLSPAAELAVRGVLVLAEQYGQRPVTLQRTTMRLITESTKARIEKVIAVFFQNSLI